MAYTLKSNATMAKAKLVWVGDNVATLGHVNLVDSSAVTAVGTVASGTQGGHVSYGEGAAFGNYLSATLAAIPTGVTYCYVIVGHVGTDVTTGTGRRIVLPPDGSKMWAITSTGTNRLFEATDLAFGVTNTGPAFADNAFPSSAVYTVIGGRTAGGAQRTISNGVGVTNGTNAAILNHAVASGVWKFGGSPGAATGEEAKFGTTLFAVFQGLDPDELNTYLGADPFAAMFDTPGPVFTGAITLDDAAPGGGFITSPSGFSGALTLDGLDPAGSFGLQPGTVTSQPLVRNNGSVVASQSLVFVQFSVPSTGVSVLTKAGVSTNDSGVFAVTDVALVGGALYLVEWLEASGPRGWGLAVAA